MVGRVSLTYGVVTRLLTRILMFVGVALATISMSALELPNTRTVWGCAVPGSGQEDLWRVADGEDSYVKLYEDRIWGTLERVDGSLRWDVGGLARGTYRYAVILDDALAAQFYDFGARQGDATQQFNYRCRLAQ